jgi:hypothetical protein
VLGPCTPRDATRETHPPPNGGRSFLPTPLAPYSEAYMYTHHLRALPEQSLITQAKHTRRAGPQEEEEQEQSSGPDGSPRRRSARRRSGRLPPLRRLRVGPGAVVCSRVVPRAGGRGGVRPGFRGAGPGVLRPPLPARGVPDALARLDCLRARV